MNAFDANNESMTSGDENEIFWKSKSNGYKSLIVLSICFGILIAVIAGIFLGSKIDNDNLRIVFLVLAMLIILATVGALIYIRKSDLKWNVSNLLFILNHYGFYFTGVVNQSSYFSAEWSEITGYSVKTSKKGKVMVNVYFDGVADAGSFGKIKYAQMVNITGVDEMHKVFEKFGIKQIEEIKK